MQCVPRQEPRNKEKEPKKQVLSAGQDFAACRDLQPNDFRFQTQFDESQDFDHHPLMPHAHRFALRRKSFPAERTYKKSIIKSKLRACQESPQELFPCFVFLIGNAIQPGCRGCEFIRLW